MSTDLVYRTPTPDDGTMLSAMARQSFVDTFTAMIDPVEMPVYLDKAYGPSGQMQQDLGDPAIDWRAAFVDGLPVGYIKLSAMTLPHDAKPGAMEVRQLYVAAELHGAGVAEALMRWAIDLARARGAPEIYLAVFDHNARATRFYARHGFTKVAGFDFVTGTQVHDDGIWRKLL